MTRSLTAAQDAAFFEDWSEWTSLDDLPPRPRNSHGEAIRWGERGLQRYSRYYCALCLRVGWVGGPAFEIVPAPSLAIYGMVRAVTGARQDPRALHGGATWSRQQGVFFVPAESWRELRAALPAIKAATKAWVESRS